MPYSVTLESPGRDAFSVVKTLRGINPWCQTTFGDIGKKLPMKVRCTTDKNEAERIARDLQNAGAKVRVAFYANKTT